MAKLARVLGKVFAGSAPLDEIGQFGSALAGNPTNTQDVATIQSLPAYSKGWGSGVISSRNYPPIEEVNGVLKTISYQTCYLLQEGIPEYDSNTEYSNTSIVKSISGTRLNFYISLQNNNIGHPLSDTTYWAQATLNSGRNVGEIVTSTIPLNDSGVHLLDGSVLSGSGIYSDFVSYISNIYNSALNYFCTETEWQTSVNTYGVCGKFVYNSTNNTVRLPKITGILEGTTDVIALGNLVEAGLPNISGTINIFAGGGGSNGALRMAATSRTNNPGGGNMLGNNNFSINASNSSSIYGNSTTVQPQTIKVLYYIVVANTQKTEIQVDIDNIATDLNGKADVSLSNVNNTGSSTGAGWAMPSNTIYTNLTLGATGSTYTAPANGFIALSLTSDSDGAELWLSAISASNEYLMCSSSHSNAANQGLDAYLQVKKNQSFEVGYLRCKSLGYRASDRFRFVYAVGAESEV